MVGIFGSKDYLIGDYLISLATQQASSSDALVASAIVTLAPGADKGAVQDRLTAVLADHPDAKVLDKEGYEHEIGGVIDKLLAFVTVMLLLAVIIALLGIVNTLALSVFERTRELGLLRAVGMTRNQVRAMVRWERSDLADRAGVAPRSGWAGCGAAQSFKGDESPRSSHGSQVLAYVAAAASPRTRRVGPSRSAASVDVLKAGVTTDLHSPVRPSGGAQTTVDRVGAPLTRS